MGPELHSGSVRHARRRVVSNSIWDEGGKEGTIFKDGDVITGFWGLHSCGGRAVSANSNYIFMGINCGSSGSGVRRYNFDGTANGNDMLTGQAAPVTGLAATATEVYVSDSGSNRIRVFSATGLNELRSFPFTNPGKLTVDRAGNVWVVQTSTNAILHYSSTGTALGGNITDAGVPTALAIDNQGRLMVGDSGTRQQILFYDISSSPNLVATFGASGGIYSGTPGQMGDQKLISPIGVGTDSSGNIYVASTVGGSEIRKLTAAGALQWQLKGLEFVDVAVADPASDGLDVYTKRQHFTMDYSQGSGKEATWKGMTIQTLKYPTDPRLSFIPPAGDSNSILAVRNIGGRKYMFMTDQYAGHLSIFQLQGEIAVPSGMISPAHTGGSGWMSSVVPQNASFIWRDSNGDGNIQAGEFSDLTTEEAGIWGWCIDGQGNIWQARETGDGLRIFYLQGTDTNGNLLYDRAHMSVVGVPAPFTQVERVEYDSATDTMYVGGYTAAHPIGNGYWGEVGTEIVRYDKWSTGNRTPRWRIVLPYDPANSRTIKAMAVAGQRVFAGMLASSASENVYVYDAGTGAALGQLVPGPEVNSSMGWIDGAQNLRAFQRSNGDYLVFVEEVAWEKVLMYRLQGTGSAPPSAAVMAPAAGATVSGMVALSATASATAGMAGVQFKVDGVNVGAEVTAPPYSTMWNTSGFSNGQHSITAMARDTAGNVGASSPDTVTVQNAGGQTVIRVNAGGPAYTDPQGNVWAADTGFSGGNAYGTGGAVAGTTTPVLYQTQRWNGGVFQYQFTVPNGSYSVKLKFAELYYTASGQRVFNVAINGQGVLSNFDAIAQAGAGTAVDKQFTTNVTGGQITIQFTPVAGEPIINAIEILSQAAATSVSVSPGTASLGASATQQFTAAVTGASNTAVTWSLNPAVGAISASGVYTAPASISAGSTVQVKATSVADPTKSASATVTLTAASGSFTPIRINAGGPDYTDPSGKVWKADTGYDAGTGYATGATITGTASSAVYQDAHYNPGGFTYTFAVPNGSYAVNLKFAEIFFTQPGQRVFNVNINGKPALSNYDVLAQAGAANTAVDRVFQLGVTNGQVVIQFTSVTGDPIVNGIEIVAVPTTAASIRVNAGGPAYTDALGQVWSADTGFSAGTSYSTASAISGTPTPDLYQTVHWNNAAFQYQAPVPNGNYAVALKFAETYYTSPGQRVFNVSINGQTVLTNFDALAKGGKPYAAIDKTLYVTVTGGQLIVQFTPVAGEPNVSAIQVIPQ